MQEAHFQILRALEANPNLTQRELARMSGISLGSVNYCLNALAQKGLIKISNFSQNPNKKRYAYNLTPKGLEQKARVTYQFLKRKLKEYERLRQEIEELKQEMGEEDLSSLQT